MTDGYFKACFRHKICMKADKATIAKIYAIVDSLPAGKLRSMAMPIVMERIGKLADDSEKFARFEGGKLELEEVLA